MVNVHVEDVWKFYGNGVAALRGVSFELEKKRG